MDDGTAIAVSIALVALLMFFTTAHLAVRNFWRVRLGKILEARGRTAWKEQLLARRTAVTLTMASLRTVSLLSLVLVIVHQLGPAPGATWDVRRYASVFGVSAALVLIFGVALPHAWARYAGEALLARVLPLLHALRALLSPLLWVLGGLDEFVRRLSGAPRIDDSTEADLIEQEILETVSEGQMQGALDDAEREMIEAVIELRDTHAGQIMTPRTEVIGVPVETSLQEVKQLIAREGHSRLPVYEDTIDNVLGVLYAKDLLTVENGEGFEPRKLMRQVPFVPESKRLRELLHEFQEQKVQMAIVLDEYGGTAGLVSIEDILEELVGEIIDEYEPPEPVPIVPVDADTVDVDARVHIDELNAELKVDLPEDADYDTIGGFVFSTLGKIPRVGEELTHDNLRIRVLDAEERKINRLRVRVVRAGSEEGGNGRRS